MSEGRVEIFPAGSPGSSTVVFITNNQIARVVSDGKEVKETTLEAPLITTLSVDKNRNGDKERNNEERLLVNFASIPHVLVNAIVSAEDKRFF